MAWLVLNEKFQSEVVSPLNMLLVCFHCMAFFIFQILGVGGKFRI